MQMPERKWPFVLFALALLGLMWYFRIIVAYVLIAGVVSLIGQPLNEALCRIEWRGRRLPRALGAATTLGSLLFLGLSAVAMFIPLVARESRRLAALTPEELLHGVRIPIGAMQRLVDRLSMGSAPVQVEEVIRQHLLGLVDVAAVTEGINYAMGFTGNLFIGFFAVSFIAFFFLKDRQLFRSVIMLPVPTPHEDRFGRVLTKGKELLTRYFIGILIEMAIMMSVIALGMKLVGIENALLIGFLGGLFNVIPYLGPMIGAALGLVIVLLTHGQGMDLSAVMVLAGKMSLVYLVAQVLDNILLQPLIYSQSVRAHPLEVFLVILVAGSAFGVVGMILAVPTYSVFRVFAGEFLNQFKLFEGFRDLI